MATTEHTGQTRYYPGSLLAATPHLSGTPYDHTVVLVVEHDEKGARGVVLNAAFQRSLQQLQDLVVRQGRRPGRYSHPVQLEVGLMQWGPGQLDHEMKSGVWLSVPATFDRVFGLSNNLWVDLVREIGRSVLRDALHIRHFPKDISLN